MKTSAGLIVRRNGLGFGMYGGRAFKKGEVICVMKGEKVVPDNLYYHGNNFRNAQINPLQVGAIHYLRLRKPYLFFNHSCAPNAGIRDISTLFALRNISKGEEITFDYSTTIDESFRCRCGSKNCRKVVVDFFGLPKQVQKRYFKAGALPGFIMRKYKKWR